MLLLMLLMLVLMLMLLTVMLLMLLLMVSFVVVVVRRRSSSFVVVIALHLPPLNSQVHAINDFALFPSEALLWDNDLIPLGAYNGSSVLAMPKLNLQFLTVYDYLLRSFKLFRLESAYQVCAGG